ncbi:MAG: hypothetical protein IKR94_02160 [Bacteroidales bacterium]|nr:hypothetical protein [Bacteroidales bacterium]MBR4214102.1 hypothetical protein [Bacteroidales bacterium]
MKIKATPLYAIVAASALMTLQSCAGDSNNQNNQQQQEQEQTQNNQTNENNFYLIPSPEDLFAFTKDKNLQFVPGLTNPVENIDKYIDVKSKEINFGTYTADMAYSAAFGKYQESLKEFKVVRQISDAIGIGNVFNQSLVNRIENVKEDRDSLKQISSDIYYDIQNFLDSKNRAKTMTLISTGGWLEFLYIVVNSVDKYSEDNPTIQRIADQKIICDNLMLRLEQQQADPGIKATITDLTPLKVAFDELTVENTQAKASTSNSGAIKVGGGMKIKMTENNFNKIKETITSVRNNITINNVK